MYQKQIFYYLQYEDLTYLLSGFYKKNDFKLVKTGLFDSPKLEFFDVSRNDTFLRNIPFGDWVLNDKFLIIPKRRKVIIRKVKQRNGTIKYAIDGDKNPNNLYFVLGGEYKEKVIIAGSITFTHMGSFSTPAFKFLKKLFLENIKKYNGWFVSEQLKQGYRLTTDIRMSKEYDLDINYNLKKIS
ncbi:MAG: hypothetical protein AB8B69_07775 [Chitinophagales bacterium]